MPDDEDAGGSAPCFAHDLVAGQPVDAATWRDVSCFRTAERTRLYALRRALPVAETRRQARAMMAALDRSRAQTGRTVVSFSSSITKLADTSASSTLRISRW